MRAAIVFFLLSCATAMAQGVPSRAGIVPGQVTGLGDCQLSVGASAVALSSCSGGIPAGAIFIWATPEVAAVRWRDDGTAPTAAIGNPVSVGSQLQYGGPLTAIQIIAQSGTSTVDVYFGK